MFLRGMIKKVQKVSAGEILNGVKKVKTETAYYFLGIPVFTVCTEKIVVIVAETVLTF
jgi:hypothetical protein